MSTVYNEGPYKNWTAISFPAGLRYFFRLNGSTSNRTTGEFYAKNANDDLVYDFPPELWQTTITGLVSGWEVDFSNVPISEIAGPGNGFSVASPVPTPCQYSVSGLLYSYPSGTLLSGAQSDLFEGATIERFFYAGIGDVTRPVIGHYGTMQKFGTPPNEICGFDLPHAPFSFSDNEEVTLAPLPE